MEGLVGFRGYERGNGRGRGVWWDERTLVRLPSLGAPHLRTLSSLWLPHVTPTLHMKPASCAAAASLGESPT